MSVHNPHPGCPYCCSVDVVRLFLAPTHVDACRCRSCGASWEENADSHQLTGRLHRESVLLSDDPRP